MTNIPKCFICKYYKKSLTKCIKYNCIPKEISKGNKNCNYYKSKDAK